MIMTSTFRLGFPGRDIVILITHRGTQPVLGSEFASFFEFLLINEALQAAKCERIDFKTYSRVR